MTAPTEIRAETSRTPCGKCQEPGCPTCFPKRTTMPKEGTTPSPRDPVSIRAQISSMVEDRKREIAARIRALRIELHNLVQEQAVLDATAELIGIVGDE